METKKIQKIRGNSLLSLEKEMGVQLSAKGPSFKINTFSVLVYLRYCLITTKI